MRADGNYPFTLVNGKYVTEEKRNNSDIYSWQGEATLYHTFKDGGEVDVKGYYFNSRRGLPGAVTLYNPISDETLWDENAFVQARYKNTSLRNGVCRHRQSITMAGIGMRMKGRNMRTDIIRLYIGRMNIIYLQRLYTVHLRLYPCLWHKMGL